MKNSTPEKRIEHHIQRYIRHKRAYGNGYRQETWLLNKLGGFLQNRGVEDLDIGSFNAWCNSLADRHPNTRHKWQQIVRNFCLYRRRTEPDCFVPRGDTLPKRSPYVTPIIVEPDQIARMLKVASSVAPARQSPLRGPVLRMATVLLYTAGLRLGELLNLVLGDVKYDNSVLRIHETKFQKTRLVPLSPSACDELRSYLKIRNRVFPNRPSAKLFCNSKRL